MYCCTSCDACGNVACIEVEPQCGVCGQLLCPDCASSHGHASLPGTATPTPTTRTTPTPTPTTEPWFCDDCGYVHYTTTYCPEAEAAND